MNKNVIEGGFQIHSTEIVGNKAFIEWTMNTTLKMPPKKKITAQGISVLTFDDKIDSLTISASEQKRDKKATDRKRLGSYFSDSWQKLSKPHKIIAHRDYFDAGELFYENIPLLGFGIKMLKKAL